jgi:hypothetical protein
LWGGSNNSAKFAWVKWCDLCRPKECGGLGIKNLRLVNVSLLTKWRWRLLVSQEALWSLVLKAKYGNEIGLSPELASFGNKRFASLWWKDLCNLGRLSRSSNGDWCSEMLVKKVGNGGGTRFWLDKWIGERPLCQEFPRLFSISCQKENRVNQVGAWNNKEWAWNLRWRRQLFLWEEEACANLLNLIGGVKLASHDDSWKCDIGVDGDYVGYFHILIYFKVIIIINYSSQ